MLRGFEYQKAVINVEFQLNVLDFSAERDLRSVLRTVLVQWSSDTLHMFWAKVTVMQLPPTKSKDAMARRCRPNL